MKRMTMFIRVGLALIAANVFAQTGNTTQPAHWIPNAPAGTLFIWGGGPLDETLLARFRKTTRTTPVVIVREAEAPPEQHDWAAALQPTEQFIEPGAFLDRVKNAKTRSPLQAIWIDLPLEKARPLESALQEIVEAGGIVGGRLAGLNLIDGIAVLADAPAADDSHLKALFDQQSVRTALHVPRRALVTITGRQIIVAGEAVDWFLPPPIAPSYGTAPSAIRQAPSEPLDLVALWRTTAARRDSLFPRIDPGIPSVRDGTLLLCGGGELPDDVWQRFVQLAGGADAPIVFLITAQPDLALQNPKGVDRLQALGIKHVRVFGHRTPAEARSPEFLNALREAKGVWLMGGRQWRYIDAYENTEVPALLRDVLARGGVIGGTSAGAAIQAELMVRGSPLNNRIVMAEGYQKGFALLPGTTVDIHVTTRNRLDEFTRLITRYPQYTGIAIDEATAAEVRGRQLTVLGTGTVNLIQMQANRPRTTPLRAGQTIQLDRPHQQP